MRVKELVIFPLNKAELLRLARALGVDVLSRDSVGDITAAIERRKSLDAILDEYRVADLRRVIDFYEFPFVFGTSKEELRRSVELLAGNAEYRAAAEACFDGDESAWDMLTGAGHDEDDEEGDEQDEDEANFDFEEEDEADRNRFRGVEYAAKFFAEMREPPPRVDVRAYQGDAQREVWQRLLPSARPLLHLATGGGKTFVANEIVHQWVSERRTAVLWITKDWRLLHQAARDICRRRKYLPNIARVGGDGSVLHPLQSEGRARLRYTTIQTLSRRLDQGVLDDIGLVVWDECHWGEHGKAGRAIFRALSKRPTALLGLTATPRDEQSSKFRKAYSKTFWELVNEGYLARPNLIEPIKTGVRFAGSRMNEGADFTKGSLVELAANRKRNELIVREYTKNVATYGRTIVFACNKEHSNVLANMFNSAGFATRSIHSDNADAENSGHLDEFARNRVDIVVNVEMLTHGIDVPSARTVFLCRPTLSDILYSQMIGRASRLDPASNKTTFNVVEFTDNLERFGEDLKTAKTFFSGAGMGAPVPAPAGSGTVSPSPAQAPAVQGSARAHRYDPTGAPTWIPDDESVPAAMRGLWFRKGQTFGFEIEVTDGSVANPAALKGTLRWRDAANAIREALTTALPGRVAPHVYEDYMGQGGDKSHEVWNVEFDASAGWEVTSRVLEGEAGYAEVVTAADTIDRILVPLGLKVNYRTGLHVHLAWTARHPAELRAFLRLARLFEPGLATLVSPSRIMAYQGGRYLRGEPNPYCRPLASVVKAEHLGLSFGWDTMHRLFTEQDSRYLTVNPRPLLRTDGATPTIEIRMHGGTTEARKMLLWLSLWQQVLWAASICPTVPDVPDRAALCPDGNIVAMAKAYLPSASQPGQQTFLRKLTDRRAEIVQGWTAHPELASWADFAARWD